MTKTSGKPYRATVINILDELHPTTVLDVASGDGWLADSLNGNCIIDGIDYYRESPPGYRLFMPIDINNGLPNELEKYDAIVCCEAIAYLDNPLAFLKQVHKNLKSGGRLILTTPNPSYASARFYFLFRGYFPSFSHFIDNRSHKSHMPWNALGWPQLWLLLGLAGFEDIKIHPVDEPKPKHFIEHLIGIPSKLFCLNQKAKSDTPHESEFWNSFGSSQTIYGRRLVISAISY